MDRFRADARQDVAYWDRKSNKSRRSLNIYVDHSHMHHTNKPHTIDAFVHDLLGLSAVEEKILNALCGFVIATTAARVARIAGVERKQACRILRTFVARKIVILRYDNGPNRQMRDEEPSWKPHKKIRPRAYWRLNPAIERIMPKRLRPLDLDDGYEPSLGDE